jgi:pimeloyl-ACP methyl ester carboxylesterase
MQNFKHGMFDHENVRIHYVTAGRPPREPDAPALTEAGSRTIVLLHGWPQTWWEWRLVMEPLAADGWFVVAPDYRGAGGSSKPTAGYDKHTMARDIRALLDHLGVRYPITLVGHDLGLMVAYAFASLYRDDVERLVLMEAPIPGTSAYQSFFATTRFSEAKLWHFHFYGAANNVAETLISGHEFAFLRRFYIDLSTNPDAISMADVERYVAEYSAPGAMRAGLEVFRAVEKDAVDNVRVLAEKGPLRMPVLGLGGTSSFFLPFAQDMLGEVAVDVKVRPIENSGHWIAEEQPEIFLRELQRFIEETGGKLIDHGRAATSADTKLVSTVAH